MRLSLFLLVSNAFAWWNPFKEIARAVSGVKRPSSTTSSTPLQVHFSLDNGRHWTNVPIHGLPNFSSLQQLGYRYADGTETWDTWRYARTHNLPLTTQFTDSENVTWKVILGNASDRVSFVVPISRELGFHGDEYDRVALDAKVRFAEVSFYYNSGGAWSSHGIRVKTRGFIDHTDGSTDNLSYWKDALDRVKQGSEIVVDLAKAYASVKGGKKENNIQSTRGLHSSEIGVDFASVNVGKKFFKGK